MTLSYTGINDAGTYSYRCNWTHHTMESNSQPLMEASSCTGDTRTSKVHSTRHQNPERSPSYQLCQYDCIRDTTVSLTGSILNRWHSAGFQPLKNRCSGDRGCWMELGVQNLHIHILCATIIIRDCDFKVPHK